MTDSDITPELGPGLLDAPRPRVALALGSGGARGYAHIGVIHELHDRGYQIVGIAGSSMGALVGGLQAADELDEFADWARSLTQRAILRLLDPTLTAAGVLRAEKILDAVRDILGDVDHRGTADPLHRGGHRSAGRQVGVAAARPGRRGDPGVHRDPGSHLAVRHRRATARRRRDPRSVADGADRGRQRRSDHRGQLVGQRDRGRTRAPSRSPRANGSTGC